MKLNLLILISVFLVFALSEAFSGNESSKGEIAFIKEHTGVTAGLCVHLSSGDGGLSPKLAQSGKFLVQGIMSDKENVRQIRRKSRHLLHR